MLADVNGLAGLPVPLYATDAKGWITFYNEAAAAFWGRRPQPGEARWCGALRLYRPDGTEMPTAECSTALALRNGTVPAEAEVITERPDGSRAIFIAYPSLLRDKTGVVTGTVNLIVEVTERGEAKPACAPGGRGVLAAAPERRPVDGELKPGDLTAARLAAIVDSSDDAIVSKNLDSVVTTWNRAATRIFGYEAGEMIGQSIKKLIPTELHREEDEILATLKRGERVDHFDTVRLTKDGRRIHVSLTISPIRDGSGQVVGASKIARDITDRKQSEALQRLLFDELNHRVKNTLASIQAIASQSVRTVRDPEEFVESFGGRVRSLAGVHDLLVERKMVGVTVADLLRNAVFPRGGSDSRVAFSGPEALVDSRLAVQLSQVLHELATNARRHGALSTQSGRLSVDWTIDVADGRELRLSWRETGVEGVKVPGSAGLGTALIERSLHSNRGEAQFHFTGDGVTCEIRLPLPDDPLPAWAGTLGAENGANAAAAGPAGRGDKRILVVEDEPLVAMEIEELLGMSGIACLSPTGGVEGALKMIEAEPFDAALLDANLSGESAGDVAAALTRKGVPFAFVTGYGREGLPEGFQNAELLSKPFDPERLRAVAHRLLRQGAVPFPGTVSLFPRKA